VSQWFIWC